MTPEQIDADMRAAVDERLAARLEAGHWRREARRLTREEKTTRRNAGLQARHHRKLNRNPKEKTVQQTENPVVAALPGAGWQAEFHDGGKAHFDPVVAWLVRADGEAVACIADADGGDLHPAAGHSNFVRLIRPIRGLTA